MGDTLCMSNSPHLRRLLEEGPTAVNDCSRAPSCAFVSYSPNYRGARPTRGRSLSNSAVSLPAPDFFMNLLETAVAVRRLLLINCPPPSLTAVYTSTSRHLFGKRLQYWFLRS